MRVAAPGLRVKILPFEAVDATEAAAPEHEGRSRLGRAVGAAGDEELVVPVCDVGGRVEFDRLDECVDGAGVVRPAGVANETGVLVRDPEHEPVSTSATVSANTPNKAPLLRGELASTLPRNRLSIN